MSAKTKELQQLTPPHPAPLPSLPLYSAKLATTQLQQLGVDIDLVHY